MAGIVTQELIYDDDGASHVPAGGHAKHVHMSDDGDFIYDFCHTESVYASEDLGLDASRRKETSTDAGTNFDVSDSDADDYEMPIDGGNDSHPYIAPLRAGSAEEPEVYDDLDDNPQVYPREEYSELQETYDTVVNDRSEIEALDNEEQFYAEKELVPQRYATASQLPKKVKGVPQPLRHKTYGEIVYGDLSRQEAVDKLTKAAQGAKNGGNGCFLLRASASLIDGVVMSVYAEHSVNHFQFHRGSDGTYRNSKGKNVGRGLVDLIEYYQKHKEGLPSTLKMQLLPPSTR